MEKLNELIVIGGLVAVAYWAVGELIKDRFSKLPTWGKILVVVGLIGLAAGDVLWQQTGAMRESYVTIYIPVIQSKPITFQTTMALWKAALLSMFGTVLPVFTHSFSVEIPATPHKTLATDPIYNPENFILVFMLAYTSLRTTSGVSEGFSMILTIGILMGYGVLAFSVFRNVSKILNVSLTVLRFISLTLIIWA